MQETIYNMVTGFSIFRKEIKHKYAEPQKKRQIKISQGENDSIAIRINREPKTILAMMEYVQSAFFSAYFLKLNCKK